MSNTEQMVSVPFQREDRYIVIKVSDLAIVPPAVGKPFAEQLIAIQRRLPKRECLVIESDWPEYEPTWAAIEARVAGKPAQHQGEPVAYQFQARDGTWHGFQSQNHYINTVEDGTWPIRPLYTHPAPVQQGKPVAFYREFVDGREYCEKPFTNDWTPLYTHAGAGEVEQGYHNSVVEGIVNRQNELREDRDTLRAQLAERDALLRDLVSMDIPRTAAAIERAKQILSVSAEPNQCDGCQAGIPLVNGAHRMGKPGGYADTMSCQAGKYASADPSAPVERDERAEFEKWYLAEYFEGDAQCGLEWLSTEPCGGYRYEKPATHWKIWKARSALERKP